MRLSALKNEKVLARIGIIVVLMALIRCIAEVLRLHYYATSPLTYEQFQPFIVGALVASIFLFVMILALFYTRHKAVILLTVLTVIALLIIKQLYHL